MKSITKKHISQNKIIAIFAISESQISHQHYEFNNSCKVLEFTKRKKMLNCTLKIDKEINEKKCTSQIITHKMENYKKISREDFMKFFRDDEKLNELTVDDRIEIFRYILIGSSDFTKKLLDEILSDYCVENIEIREIKNGNKE